MARIKIKDLPKDQKVTKEEMRQVFGGLQVLGGLRSMIAPTQMIPSSPGVSSMEASSLSFFGLSTVEAG
jgi:hypothetical protein